MPLVGIRCWVAGEQAMKSRKQLYADIILQHMPVGAAIYDAQDWRLLAANPCFLSYLDTFVEPRWQHGQAVGHCITELHIQVQTSDVSDIFARVAQSGQAEHVESMAILTPQGTLTYWNWTLDVLRDEEGHIQYLLQTVIDVTAQVRARRAAEQQRLSTVLDQLPEGILMADAISGVISYVNPTAAHFLGMTQEQLMGMAVSRLQSFDEIEACNQPGSDGSPVPWNFFLIQALSGETIRGKETVISHADGTRLNVLISAAPLYTSNGVMSSAVLILQDITEQKSIEQQKNEFLWMANHELRTPVTIIQGFAELLVQSEHGLDEETRSALLNIIEQSEYLSGLIESMLDMTRLEQQQFQLQLAPHDLLALVMRIVESQAVTTSLHQLRFVTEGIATTDELICLIDRERMTQVLSNLLNNAMKYSPRGGTIEVGLRAIARTSRQQGSHVYREALIWVKDQGIGIAAADIPHIFDRFYRSRVIDRSMSGFGIGLYIVKEVVTRHGGRVWVESAPGRGSTFYLWLPLKTQS